MTPGWTTNPVPVSTRPLAVRISASIQVSRRSHRFHPLGGRYGVPMATSGRNAATAFSATAAQTANMTAGLLVPARDAPTVASSQRPPSAQYRLITT
jgi:hypothetical protein